MPVDSSATVWIPQRFNQRANSWSSGVKAWKVRTGWGARSLGTATRCSLAPTSIPAASGLMTGSTWKLTLLLLSALLFFLFMAIYLGFNNGAGSARRGDRFTNLSQGGAPPQHP